MKSRISTIFLKAGVVFVWSVFFQVSPVPAKDGEVQYCFNDWPPYATMKADEASGISVDILREASARAGLRASFVELPWNRCLEMVRQDELDAVMDAAERAEFLQGEVGFSFYTNTFWVRDEFPTDALDFEALAGRTIGLIDGYVYPDALMGDIEGARMKIESSVDDGANIRKLAFKRVDAVIGDYVATLLFAQENSLNLKPLSPTYSADRLYPSFNRDRANLHARLDEQLAAMLADGAIDEIYRNHIGKSFAEIKPQ